MYAIRSYYEGFVHHQRAAVERTPEHHLPVCAMPKTAQQHRQHQVDLGAEFALAVAAERDVEIVSYNFV